MTATTDRKLTLKQRKWLKLYIETGNATEAAAQAYAVKDRDSARQIGHENIAKLDFAELMEESGLSDQLLNYKLAEGLEANKQLATRIIIKNPQRASTQAGELMPANNQTDDFIEVPDYATRHKYLETALKLKKRLGTNENLTQINVGELNVAWTDGKL